MIYILDQFMTANEFTPSIRLVELITKSLDRKSINEKSKSYGQLYEIMWKLSFFPCIDSPDFWEMLCDTAKNRMMTIQLTEQDLAYLIDIK